MPAFRSLAEFKRWFKDGARNTGRPDDGTFDTKWITHRQNAWRLAEGGMVPFTKTIEKGKYDRNLAGLLAALEPGSLPLEGERPVVDVHDWLARLHATFEPDLARDQLNVLTELFIRSLFAYALPTAEALQRIADFSAGGIVEMAAGRGYWAALLGNLGVDVEAFEQTPDPTSNPWTGFPEKLKDLLVAKPVAAIKDSLWFPVQEGTPASLASRHREATLLLIWPPKDGLATECLERFPGSRLVYVGEPRGLGCAEDDFFGALWAGWDLVGVIDIPRFPWLYDRVFLYERTPPSPRGGRKRKSGGH